MEITATSTFTGDISARNIYAKTEVKNILTRKGSSAAISTAVTVKADKSTTYSKTDVDSL